MATNGMNKEVKIKKKKREKEGELTHLQLNPRTYIIHPPTVVQGGGGGLMEPLPRDFDMLQYFKTILPLVENL